MNMKIIAKLAKAAGMSLEEYMILLETPIPPERVHSYEECCANLKKWDRVREEWI